MKRAPKVTKAPSTDCHPDDWILHCQVRAACLALWSGPLQVFPMPGTAQDGLYGTCCQRGEPTGTPTWNSQTPRDADRTHAIIRIAYRCQDSAGHWYPDPLPPAEVWNTAAHELAHLIHWQHGQKHAEQTREYARRLEHWQQDHTQAEAPRDRILRKVAALLTTGQGEQQVGNAEAAQAFAQAAARLMDQHTITQEDLDHVGATRNEPIVSISLDPRAAGLDKTGRRCAWTEDLLRSISHAYGCTWTLYTGRNTLNLIGTRSAAELAEYVFLLCARTADQESTTDLRAHRRTARLAGHQPDHGFRAAWLDGFTSRIAVRLADQRRDTIKETVQATQATAAPVSEAQALIRIDWQLARAKAYIDMITHGWKSRALGGSWSTSATGRQAGTAAADKVGIGRALGSGRTARKALP